MKKFLSLVLAVVMVLSMAVTALAVNVQNAKSETVATPNALNAAYAAGILKGEGDKAPSSGDKLTRWQMALIALRLYTLVDSDGLKAYDLDDENWANYVVDFGDKEVKYEDCEYPSALGAILFVQEKGFILGYSEDDRTYFRPAQPVTYAEALTIMVRILGWDSPAMNTNWPYNYVEQAAKLGLTAGISKVGMDDQVTYGTLAQLIYNALNSKRYLPAAKTEEFGTVLDAIGADKALAELASALLIFGYLDAEGEFVQITEGQSYHTTFTLVKKVGKLGNYIFDYQDPPKSGKEYDLGNTNIPCVADYLYGKGEPKVYVGDSNIMKFGSNSRVRNWFWFTYEFDFDDEGNVVLDESTRKAALTHGQTRATEPSANAWYMQTTPDHNTAMVYEPMKKGETLIVINVDGDIYLAHVTENDKDAYDDGYDKAYAEKEKEILADKAAVKDIQSAAIVYFRQGIYWKEDSDPFTSLWGATEDMAGLNNWSLNGALDLLGLNFMMIDEDELEDFQDALDHDPDDAESSYWTNQYDLDNCDGLVKSAADVKKFFTADGNDWSKWTFETFVEPSGAYDWAIEKYMAQFEDEFAAAGAKAAQKSMSNFKNVLSTIPTDVEGKEFLGWSDLIKEETRKFPVVKTTGDSSTEDVKFHVYSINALYEADNTKFTWTGEEKALGSYVTKTTLKSGVTTTEVLEHGLFSMDDLDATRINLAAEFIGTCNGATYGAWCIDTDGDGLYNVVVYCNFVAPVVADAE